MFYNWCISYLIEIHQQQTLRTFVLQDLLCLLIESLHLVLSLSDDPLQSTEFTWRSTLVKQVNIDVIWDWVLALVNSLEKCWFSATVLSQQTISAAVCKFEGGIGDENATVEGEGGSSDFDISAGLDGAEHTSGDTIGKTMLVHLLRQSLHLIHLLCRCRRLLVIGKGVSITIEEGWCLVTSDRRGARRSLWVGLWSGGDSLLGSLAIGGSLSITGGLWSGNHYVKVVLVFGLLLLMVWVEGGVLKSWALIDGWWGRFRGGVFFRLSPWSGRGIYFLKWKKELDTKLWGWMFERKSFFLIFFETNERIKSPSESGDIGQRKKDLEGENPKNFLGGRAVESLLPQNLTR